MAYLIVISLILNSLWYTSPDSKSNRGMYEFSKVSFSLNVIKGDYWSYLASVFPTVTFFGVILVAYTYANAFGVSIMYLGVISFFQMIQFYQNLKTIYFYYLGKKSSKKEKKIA